MRQQTSYLRRRFLWIFALPLSLMIWSPLPASAFDIAIGNEQSNTYKVGIGISSLVKIKLLPSFDIDLQPQITGSDQESLEALRDGTVAFALIAVDTNRPLSDAGLKAVASLGGMDSLTTMLVARRDVDNASVARILEAIFDNVSFLAAIDPDLENLDPDSAVMGLTLPLHDGAKQYHATRWASVDSAPDTRDNSTAAPAPAAAAATPIRDDAAALPPETHEGAADARNYVLYFGFDDATLDQATQATLEIAADFASTLEAPAIIIAAYTDSVGNAEYNYLLAERRATSVVQGLEALQVRYSRLDLSLFGERSPWAVTLDDVNEAGNRRVELFIEEPVPEVQPLPIPAGFSRESVPAGPSVSSDTEPRKPTPSTANTRPGTGSPLPRSLM